MSLIFPFFHYQRITISRFLKTTQLDLLEKNQRGRDWRCCQFIQFSKPPFSSGYLHVIAVRLITPQNTISQYQQQSAILGAFLVLNKNMWSTKILLAVCMNSICWKK